MQINPIHHYKNNKILSFKKGLTPNIARQIEEVDVFVIEKQLQKANIESDFKDNKVIAWSCNKILEILTSLKIKFNQEFALPRAIYVEDFRKLNIDINQLEDAYGFCNLIPAKLINGSNQIIPSRALFFNSNCHWNDIDLISDIKFENGDSSSNLFLYTFLHEFSHSAHEDRIIKKYGIRKARKILGSAISDDCAEKYQAKYNSELSSISKYALENPLEAVAEDTTRLICNSLDANLSLAQNPFLNSPYDSFVRCNIMNPNKCNKRDKLLRNFWNGKL